MHIPFESMPDHARIWVYQSSQALSKSDLQYLEEKLRNLCDQWSAHGTPLHTSYSIQLSRFIILSVDEQQAGASGCSIDGSVRQLQLFQQALGIDFFDRATIPFLVEDEIQTFPLAELKSLFVNHTLRDDSVTFNNLVATKADWSTNWKVKVKDSWIARYLPKREVSD